MIIDAVLILLLWAVSATALAPLLAAFIAGVPMDLSDVWEV